MMEKLIEFVVNNKFMVILVTVIIIAWGVYSLINTPIDAIPDLSDVQVIIISEWMGQSPQEVEDQVTFPLTSAMLAVPKVTNVRGYSYFGFSLVYIIFEDGTDIYWARSRVLEYMNYVTSRLPEGVTSTLGPDATGVGWVYQYVVEPLDEKHQKSLGELRSIQDWYVRYQLATVPGVAEVASIGGFVMQYQVHIDPDKLLAYNIPINKVMMAIRNSNSQAGARLLEMSGTEYMVRGLGYIENLNDLKSVVVGHSHKGTPILVKDIGYVQRGPDLRRGLAEKDGKGEAVGGIVVMRFGENALEVIDKVKQKIEQIKPGLESEGVKIVPVYDRSSLINRSIETLIEKLLSQIIIIALVCVLFLWHVRSALVVIATLPLSILISLIIMKVQGLNANIMSLGGIVIAIGTLIDASIVMVEHAHKLKEQEGDRLSHWEIMIEASKQVGPSLFFALLIITVSFMPIFTLEAQEGRLFKPLAFTKSYAMAAGAIVSIILVPVLMGFFIRGKITPQENNPISRFLIRSYRPVNRFVLRFPWLVILLAILVLLATYLPLKRLGSEFMPSLNEGDVLYMPTTRPGISITEARSLLQIQDKILADKTRFPEVKTVFGKIGRAETATDPAPLSMVETTITLKQPPPSLLSKLVRKMFFPGEEEEYEPGEKIRNIDEVSQAMLEALDFPGVRNAYPEGPIKTRIDMQATGIKTPVGIKVMGDDLRKIEEIAAQIGQVVQDVPGTTMVYPDRIMDGN
jgi:Cu(I)/Ag(I) efflux system membrane protein CusA/SilA